jgi:hypothetical protein
MFVIMAVATDERVADGFAGIAVGLTVGLCALMGGPFTGASMNPARSLGPAVAGGIWDVHWVYWLAPVAGMVVAARVYELLRPAGRSSTPRAFHSACRVRSRSDRRPAGNAHRRSGAHSLAQVASRFVLVRECIGSAEPYKRGAHPTRRRKAPACRRTLGSSPATLVRGGTLPRDQGC